jgi:hypothetical protein
MADAAKVIHLASVELMCEQRKAIEEAGRWVTEAFAELGGSYLEFAQLEARYLEVKAQLVACRAKAINAEMSRGNVVAAIAKTMDLPPGEWTYDSDQGKLVRKDT